jgi:hypothetical protein
MQTDERKHFDNTDHAENAYIVEPTNVLPLGLRGS